MNNTIPPINPSFINSLAQDKSVTGTVSGLPSEFRINLKMGDSIFLQTIMNSSSTPATSSSTTNIEALLRQVVNNQIKEHPVKLSIDKNLNLSKDTPSELVVKVSSKDINTPQIKVVSINSQPPEKFIIPSVKQNTALATLASQVQSPKTTNINPQVINNPKALVATQPQTETTIPQLKITTDIPKMLERYGDQGFGVKNILINELKGMEFHVSVNSSLPVDTTVPKSPIEKVFENLFNKMPSEIVTEIKGELSKLQTTIGEVIENNKGVKHIKTSLGDIYLDKNYPFEKGEKILLNIDKIVDGKQSQSLLNQILKPLHDIGKEDLVTKILNKIPQTNARMLPNLVSFIKSAGSNDISQWLGKEVVEQLTSNSGAEGKEVLSKLGNFFSNNIKEGQIWRTIEVPIFNEGILSQIKVSIKKNSSDEEDDGEKKAKEKYGTRFVVDTNFSILGKFQFDGFSHAKNKQFDLIVRTEKKIDEDIVSNIMAIFKNTLHEVDYVGNINININDCFIKIDDNDTKDSLSEGIYI